MKKYLLSLLLITSLVAAAHTGVGALSDSDDEDQRKLIHTGILPGCDSDEEEGTVASFLVRDKDLTRGTKGRAASAVATTIETVRSSLGVLRFTSEGKIIDFREHAGGRVHKPVGGAITFKAGQTLSGTRLSKPLSLQGSPKKLRTIFDDYAPEDD